MVKAIVTVLYRNLEGERVRERRPVRREEIMPVTIKEKHYVSEPIETRYLKFWLLILLGNSAI